MEAIKVYTGNAAVMNRKNVDTDQIIPKQFLKRIERSGFGQFLFFNWRFDEAGNDRPEFELNQEKNKGATILIAGENFGCGSSREHAPWALLDYGFKIIISPSFADIFKNNCMKNGIVPIVLSEAQVAELMEKGKDGGYELTVDLPNQKVIDHAGFEAEFEFHPYWKEMLINGWDEISITEQYEEQIQAYEREKMPVPSI